MGNTYCDRFSSHFAIKTTEKSFSPLTFQGHGGDCGTGVWGQLGVDNLPTGDCGKGNFVFDWKHFWDALQTFYTFLGGLLWVFGASQWGHDCE